MSTTLNRAAFLIMVIAAAGCTPYSLRGQVADAKGEPLPGVAVKVEDGEEVITDALGRFKVAAHGGACDLSFFKTGFTTGRLAMEVTGPGKTEVPVVSLWSLPDSSGVFFFEDNLYRKADYAETAAYTLDKNTVLYAIRPGNIAQTSNPLPRLMCFELPSFDAELCSIVAAKAAPLDAPDSQRDIWVRGNPVPMRLSPIDEPERRLWEVSLFDPLEPGVYCLHWGALRGHTATDPRVYIFEVTAPAADGGAAESGAQ